MVALGLFGGDGRMGRAIAAVIDADPGATLAGMTTGSADDPATLARQADVLIDFSVPTALAAHLAAARTTGKPMLVGTTGLSAEDHRAIDDAARDIAILQTGNTSLGITLLACLVEQAAARLGPDWDIEIAEMHHRHKVDAPSGTALLLGEAAASGRGAALADVRVDRHAGERRTGTIGFAALRGGSVAGDHRVILATEGERLELGHVAQDRSLFARGAVRAARWLHDRPAGRYRMADVLGL